MAPDCEIDGFAFNGCPHVYVFSQAGSLAETFCATYANCTFVEEPGN